MNIEEIIKSIIKEILPLINKKILIFISGGKVNAESTLRTLAEFELIDYSIVMSDAAKLVIDKALVEKFKGNIIDSMDKLKDAINSSEIILAPILTRNTLSKVALGIEDNLVTTGMARAIMKSKEIIAVRDSYDPKNSVNISEGLSSNSAYNSMILNYENTLNTFGVKFIEANEFRRIMKHRLYNSFSQISSEKEVNELSIHTESRAALNKNEVILNKSQEKKVIFNSSILTVKDINQILDDDVIVLKEGTIITPLAKDYIYTNKIKVQFC